MSRLGIADASIALPSLLQKVRRSSFLMNKTDICFCSVKKIGKVFRLKTQTGQSVVFFCVLGKRERFLVEETQTVLSSKKGYILSQILREFPLKHYFLHVPCSIENYEIGLMVFCQQAHFMVDAQHFGRLERRHL